jgi:hypothetical protein
LTALALGGGGGGGVHAANVAPLLPMPPALPMLPALRECCVCLADVAAADLLLLLPCAHRCVCEACASMLLSAPQPRCPKCREDVARASRVFED